MVLNRDRRGWATAGTCPESDIVVDKNIEEGKRFKIDLCVFVKVLLRRVTFSLGNEYEFRVIAINKSGAESEISASSKPILAKARFVKPKINRYTIQHNFLMGQSGKIMFLLKGYPTRRQVRLPRSDGSAEG